jgi:hypothetical protein
MNCTIYLLENTIKSLEPFRDFDDGTRHQIKEIEEAIAVLKRHEIIKRLRFIGFAVAPELLREHTLSPD